MIPDRISLEADRLAEQVRYVLSVEKPLTFEQLQARFDYRHSELEMRRAVESALRRGIIIFANEGRYTSAENTQQNKPGPSQTRKKRGGARP